MDTDATLEPWEPRVAKLPRPLEGGSYSVESLGRIVDGLLGHERAARGSAERLEPFLMRREDMPADPEPAQIPEPLPGGSEPATKSDDPSGERR
ncbi:MAG: hypothetical protein ACRDH7_04425 [Actinomycetota bacterium]